MVEKRHRRLAMVLVIIICIAMIASGGSMFFSGGGVPPSNSNTSTNVPNSAADYQAKKVRIAAIAEQAKADPHNVPLQNDLANEYYDAGMEAQSVAPTEAQGNFSHAVEAYQNVLKTNQDSNVMVYMATAAFYSGDNDLAEKTFKEALVLKPDSYNALVSYGGFLADVKQDLTGAITQWQKAQTLASDSSEKSRVVTLISQAQSQLKSPSSNGVSNPNPAVDNGVAKPATPGK